ncbi:pyruvate, water dikinase regulatory protein [Candidatus Aquarickettsia rohweri]|uniref:Kinase/pyrophosphorylase n=1 Tax=Candidatus Aquarickettsia rohweri TaxID=2602574 RepID=A0A3R9XS26_9RICK|nr:pyruvate, water dikinase regulatory protein [Candidatus Aquarickettsia rohweri]RST62867.1 kinase/pyrophosphorylase [Candidatus Aquarickettsia rohweri]
MSITSLNLYMVSDSSGETVIAVSKAVVSQFDSIKIHEYMWPLVRSKKQIDEVVVSLKKNPGVVIYTIINRELREYLKEQCNKLNVKCFSPIASIISEICSYYNIQTSKKTPEKEILSDTSYFKKIEAINFTVNHDDGQQINDFNNADILLVGVSRTSKSPTSLYLAQRGYKVANWPIINDVEYDFSLIKNPLIVGLTVSIDRLLQIRQCRLIGQNFSDFRNDYTDALSIREEIRYANKIFNNNKFPVVDVTSKAIEEISAEIINLYFAKKGEHLVNT